MKPYYQDDWATIYHGDCREFFDKIESVDLVLTDPPYEGFAESVIIDTGDRGKHKTLGQKWNIVLDQWMPQSWNIAKYGLMSFCSWHFLDKVGLQLQNNKIALIAWIKRDSPPMLRNVPHYATEYIWAFKKAPGLAWKNLKTYYDVVGCHTSGKNERIFLPNGKAAHECQKPLRLIKELLRINPDTTFDPFMGVGTTLLAAKQLGKKAIGIEIEEKYCEIAANRLRQEVFDLTL